MKGITGLAFLLFTSFLYSQTETSAKVLADSLFSMGDYGAAVKYYEKLDNSPSNLNLIAKALEAANRI